MSGTVLKARQKLGKYKIRRRLGKGGFASVYEALDTVEGSRVALKVPHPHLMTPGVLKDFYREVRLASRLDHANILPLKNADFIDKRFVIVSPLGRETLYERLKRRMSVRTGLELAEQAIAAVAFAHRHRVIHCDIKPENLILFPGNQLRLTDFGIAKVAHKTVRASGSGTVGYIAPEQAMGRPSQRSDVFSLGLILYRMFSGELPEWPFAWPPPRIERLRRKLHPEMIDLIRRAIEVEPRQRFRDGQQMLNAFRRLRPRALRFGEASSKARRGGVEGRDWRSVRLRQFRRRWGRVLAARHRCSKCEGPVSEAMSSCPWCGESRAAHPDHVAFPASCPRCRRGVKLDWRFCPWCFGPGFENVSSRRYTDVRYEGRCANPSCARRDLMPFMRYCPWCRRKVRRKWKIPGSAKSCRHCGWGVVEGYWSHCPWCSRRLGAS